MNKYEWWWEYRKRESWRMKYLAMCRKYERMWGHTETNNRLLYDDAGRPL